MADNEDVAPKRVDGYVRVSQVKGRGGDSFISPVSQEERIRAWATLHGYDVGQIHVELDQSGAKADRPKLLRALERVETGESHGLIVARLDRFGRSLGHALAAIERIEKAGGVFASVADGFDLRTDTGRLVLRIMLSLAEFELDRIRGNFAEARARAVGRGVHISPVPPTGYRRRSDGGLEPDQVTGPVVSEIFALRAQGVALADLARLAERRGVKGPYGHEQWTLRAIKTIVRNRVYLGEARHGEFTLSDAHTALTDEVTFKRAQRDGVVNPPRSAHRPALLSGLIRCAGCRYGMGSYVPRGSVRHYRCHRNHPAGQCPEPATITTASGLEDYVVDRMFDRLGSGAAHARQPDHELQPLENAVEQAREGLAAFRDDPRVIAVLGMDSFMEGLRARQAVLDEAERDLVAATSTTTNNNQLTPCFADLRTAWNTLDVSQQRRVMSGVIDSVFIRRGRGRHGDLNGFVHIAWLGSGIEVPRRGKRSLTLLPPVRW